MLQLGEEHSCKTDKSGNVEDISSAFGDIQLITIKYMSLMSEYCLKIEFHIS